MEFFDIDLFAQRITRVAVSYYSQHAAPAWQERHKYLGCVCGRVFLLFPTSQVCFIITFRFVQYIPQHCQIKSDSLRRVGVIRFVSKRFTTIWRVLLTTLDIFLLRGLVMRYTKPQNTQVPLITGKEFSIHSLTPPIIVAASQTKILWELWSA